MKVGKDILAVDFSGNQMKIARGRSTGAQILFDDVFLKKFAQATDAEIMREVLDYFKKNKVSPKQVICTIPSKLFISKNVEIPSTEKEEIAKIIDLQAGRFTPYSRDEIVIDFLCMETPTQHYTSVLLVIVNRALVDRYCRIFEDIGIQVRIMISSEALALTYRDWLGEADSVRAPIGGLCIGEDSTDFTVMDHQQMVFVRSLPVGAEHFSAGKSLATTEFMNELNKSLAAYQDQGVGKPLKSLTLTGLVQDPIGLKTEILNGCPALQRFETVLQIKDSQLLFKLSENASKKVETLKPSSFVELMAAATQSHKAQIDLIPKEIKLRRRFRDQSREVISLGITVMTIFFVLSLFLYSKIYFKNTRMQKLTEAGKPTFEEARSLERISTKNRVVRKILKTRGKGLSAFDQATSLLGESTYLSHMAYDIEGKINLGGTTESMSQVFALVNRLEASNHYLSVKAKETKSRREGTKDVADFEIECILPDSPAADKWEAEKSGKISVLTEATAEKTGE